MHAKLQSSLAESLLGGRTQLTVSVSIVCVVLIYTPMNSM
jgi:hypothetical protein